MISMLGKQGSRFQLGDKVKIKSGLVGEVIGMAEYRWDWCYRLKFPNKKRTLYKEERDLPSIQ